MVISKNMENFTNQKFNKNIQDITTERNEEYIKARKIQKKTEYLVWDTSKWGDTLQGIHYAIFLVFLLVSLCAISNSWIFPWLLIFALIFFLRSLYLIRIHVLIKWLLLAGVWILSFIIFFIIFIFNGSGSFGHGRPYRSRKWFSWRSEEVEIVRGKEWF